MRLFPVLVVVIAFSALSASQTVQSVSSRHHAGDDPRCSELRSQSGALPSYDGPGFGTVEYSSPDEPFIVPAGCFQYSCTGKGKFYRVLSCPKLKAKSFSRSVDGNGSPASVSTDNSVPASK